MISTQTKQQPLFHLPVNDLVAITHNKRTVFYVQRESLLILHRNAKIKRGSKKKDKTTGKMAKNGTIHRIQTGEQKTLNFSDLKYIFDRSCWFFVLADPEKINADFKSLDDNIVVHGVIRGEDTLPINELRKYVVRNIIQEGVANIPIKSDNISKDATKMREFLDFDIQEYRNKCRSTSGSLSGFNYLTERIDRKCIYLFKTYDIHGVMPMNIGDARFDGMTVATEEGNLSICVSSKNCPERRVTTCIALLYPLMPNSDNEREGDNLLIEVKPEHYDFVGHFLLRKDEIKMLREAEFTSWGLLREEAKKFGMSTSYLHNFLFFDRDWNKWNLLNNVRPDDYSEYGEQKGGGPGWTRGEAFKQFYSPTLYNTKMSRIRSKKGAYNQTARTMVARGGKKDKQAIFKEIMDTNNT